MIGEVDISCVLPCGANVSRGRRPPEQQEAAASSDRSLGGRRCLRSSDVPPRRGAGTRSRPDPPSPSIGPSPRLRRRRRGGTLPAGALPDVERLAHVAEEGAGAQHLLGRRCRCIARAANRCTATPIGSKLNLHFGRRYVARCEYLSRESFSGSITYERSQQGWLSY